MSCDGRHKPWKCTVDYARLAAAESANAELRARVAEVRDYLSRMGGGIGTCAHAVRMIDAALSPAPAPDDKAWRCGSCRRELYGVENRDGTCLACLGAPTPPAPGDEEKE